MNRRRLLMVASALVLSATPAVAQGRREDMLRAGLQAFRDFQPQRAIQLLSGGVDPAIGPLDSLWGVGVQTLVDVLVDQRRDSLAILWARWALRQAPAFAVDTLTFAPPVVETFRRARAEIAAVREPRGETTWRWASAADLAAPGSVRLGSSLPAMVRLLVRNVGVVPTGEALALPAGSYLFQATADGFLPAEITREVLPGVETVLSFRLLPSAAGYLYVASQPWGTVFVDGERVGNTTLVGYRVAQGSHRVRVQREGYLPVDTTIQVDRDAATRVALRLERRP